MAAKLSDQELRLRALFLKNAYDQPALIQRPLFETDRLLDVINIYQHENWPSEKVYCSVCGGHHHRKGFTATVVAEGGAVFRMLFGSKCGADAFGENWNAAEKRMKGEHDRQWELQRLDRLAPIVDPLRDALETWEVRADRVAARKTGFARGLGELYSRLSEAANVHNGQLTTVEKVKGEHITVPVARLRGADFFMEIDLVLTIKGAIIALDRMALAIAGTESVPTITLRARRKSFERTFEELQNVARQYAGAQEFFTAESFQLVAGWTRRYRVTKDQYRWTGEGIEYEDGRPGHRLPNPFPDLGDEPLDLIAEYRRAD